MIEWLEISTEAPKFTDWLSAIAAIFGIPLVIFSIYKLVTKDKDKEKRLKSLESIATSQNEIISKMQSQIDELAKQTSEFQRQTSLMSDSHLLLEKQIALQMDSKNQAEKRLDLEKTKRLTEIKPYFKFNGGSIRPDRFEIMLVNVGEEASDLELENPSDSLVKFQQIKSKVVSKEQKLKIHGKADNSKTNLNSKQVTFVINLKYNDMDDNKYVQKISRTKTRNYTVDPPILILENKYSSSER